MGRVDKCYRDRRIITLGYAAVPIVSCLSRMAFGGQLRPPRSFMSIAHNMVWECLSLNLSFAIWPLLVPRLRYFGLAVRQFSLAAIER